MNTALLQNLGLSPSEAKIYQALITYGGSGVSTISLRSKVHRRNVYDAVHRLIDKGLVYEVFGQRETVYEAVEPSKLMEIVREQEIQLSAALPSLTSEYNTKRAPQRAHIYKGVEGVKNYLREALRVGEDVYALAAKGAWFDPRLKTFTEWFLKEAKKKKMKYHYIYDYEATEKIPDVIREIGGPHKFFPKGYSSVSTMDIFGDYVVTFTGLGFAKLEDDLTIFVMVSPGLAESYRTWWKLVWDLLPDAKKRSRH